MFGWKLGPVFKQYIIVTVANFTFFHLGLSMSWVSPIVVLLSDADQKILPEPLTQEDISWITSISLLIDLFAFFFSGYLANTIGRKNCIILSCVPRFIACILFIFTCRVWMLICGRAFCGLSDAFSISVTSSYASEIASKQIRGGLGTVSQIWSTLGSMIMLSVGPFVSFNAINAIHTTIIAVTFISLLFLPESPYFLYSYQEKSINILTSIRESEISASKEMDDYPSIKQTITMKILLNNKTALKTLAKVLFIAMCSQFSGNSFMSMNIQIIFVMTNTTISSAVSSVIIGVIQLLACFCTMYLSDRFGKKPVLKIALIMQAIGLVGLGTFFKMAEEGIEIKGFLNYLPLISMAVAMFFYCMGLGSLMWILFAELFEGQFRAFGVSAGVFVTCLFGFLTLNQLNTLMNLIGAASIFWMCAVFCVITFLFIQFFIPETKGKSFSQIQDELRTNKIGAFGAF